MAADSQAMPDAPEIETETPVVRRRGGSDIGFDAKLAPTCMMWSMAVVLGFLILTMVFWGVSNSSHLFK